MNKVSSGYMGPLVRWSQFPHGANSTHPFHIHKTIWSKGCSRAASRSVVHAIYLGSWEGGRKMGAQMSFRGEGKSGVWWNSGDHEQPHGFCHLGLSLCSCSCTANCVLVPGDFMMTLLIQMHACLLQGTWM